MFPNLRKPSSHKLRDLANKPNYTDLNTFVSDLCKILNNCVYFSVYLDKHLYLFNEGPMHFLFFLSMSNKVPMLGWFQLHLLHVHRYKFMNICIRLINMSANKYKLYFNKLVWHLNWLNSKFH